MFWGVPTSSPWKCSRGEDWLPTTFCSSFIWRAVASAWLVSLDIRIKSGWSRSPAAPPRRLGVTFLHSVKEECLSKLILFGEGPLSRTLAEFSAHYHGERNHQGKGNELLFPEAGDERKQRGRTR